MPSCWFARAEVQLLTGELWALRWGFQLYQRKQRERPARMCSLMIWGFPEMGVDRRSVIFRFETRMVIVVFHGHDQCHSDRQECHGRRDFRWSFIAKCWRVGTMCKICIVYGARSWCTNGPKQRAILGVSSHPRFGPSIWPNVYSQETHVWLESGWLETLENRPSPHPGGPVFFFCQAKKCQSRNQCCLAMSLLYSSTQLVTRHGVISQFSGPLEKWSVEP